MLPLGPFNHPVLSVILPIWFFNCPGFVKKNYFCLKASIINWGLFVFFPWFSTFRIRTVGNCTWVTVNPAGESLFLHHYCLLNNRSQLFTFSVCSPGFWRGFTGMWGILRNRSFWKLILSIDHHHQVVLPTRISLTFSIHPYGPSLLEGLLNYTLCPHWADIDKFSLVDQ